MKRYCLYQCPDSRDVKFMIVNFIHFALQSLAYRRGREGGVYSLVC